MKRALARAIVTIAASFVPVDLQDRWREEWLAEIESRKADGANHRRRVLRAALGAPRDALSVRFMKTRDQADRRRWLARTLPHLIDFKLAARVARSTPLLSLTAVSALGVGIALATAASTVVKMVLYSQLYTTDGAPVMALEDHDRVGRWDLPITLKEFERRRRLLTSFADVAGYTQRSVSVSLDRQDEVRPVGFVTANTFRLLGVPPLAGRDFGDTDAWSSSDWLRDS